MIVIFFVFGALMFGAGILRIVLLVRERPRARWARLIWSQSILLLIGGLLAMSALIISPLRSYAPITVGIIFLLNAGMSILLRNGTSKCESETAL